MRSLNQPVNTLETSKKPPISTLCWSLPQAGPVSEPRMFGPCDGRSSVPISLPMEELDMSTFDLAPLFRSTVGFDRMMSLLDASARDEQAYPPYNIEKVGDDAYRITMAVAGFGDDDLTIVAQGNSLVISGKQKRDENKSGEYLYRGIAGRAFERRFQLADHIKVSGAELANGLLHVDLVREVPEAMKPRTIKVNAAPKQVLETKAAA
jgi:molecular chaperone IbpA